MFCFFCVCFSLFLYIFFLILFLFPLPRKTVKGTAEDRCKEVLKGNERTKVGNQFDSSISIVDRPADRPTVAGYGSAAIHHMQSINISMKISIMRLQQHVSDSIWCR